MRRFAAFGVFLFGLVLLLTASARAQHGHDGDSHEGPQGHRDNDRGRGPQHSRPAPEERHDMRTAERHEEHGRQPQMRPEHQPQGHAYGHDARVRPVHDVWQPHRAAHWQREHHSWRERGGYRGERIPMERFREHFGRGHWFRVHSVPVIVVDNRPRFQCSGYWFTLVDPWPEYWSATWYQTDDVYIDYVNDGYYMYNRAHPGVAIAVSVSL